jgi:tRNA (guanine-N7-)-methyltransferase
VYFPDPWWKKRHHKRRVMNERFVREVARTLMPGGALHFWTDVRERFDATLELIAEQVALEGPLEVAERPAEHNLDYRTHFERRMRLTDRPVFRAEFRRSRCEK